MIHNEAQDPDFGKPLVVTTLTTGQMITWLVIGVLMLALSVSVMRSKGGHRLKVAHLLGASVFFIMGLTLLVVSLKNLSRGTRRSVFFELGVRVSQGGTTRAVAYRDTDVVYFLLTKRYGVERVLELHPTDGAEIIRAGTTAFGNQPPTERRPSVTQIEALRDIVVRTIADRMMSTIAGGGTVPWCGGTVLSPQGVIVNSRIVPWNKLDERANQGNGRYQLLEQGEKRGLAAMRMMDRNFLPGWHVVRRMRGNASTAT